MINGWLSYDYVSLDSLIYTLLLCLRFYLNDAMIRYSSAVQSNNAIVKKLYVCVWGGGVHIDSPFASWDIAGILWACQWG